MSTALDKAGIYNDLSGLQDIRKLGKKNSPEALASVAKQFESMFTSMMLKSMRDANKVFEDGNVGHDQQSQFYRDMYDQQLSLSLSHGKGIGLASVLTKQFQMQYKNAPHVSTQSQALNTVETQKHDKFIEAVKGISKNSGSHVLGDTAAMQQLQQAMTVDVQPASDGEAASEQADWANSVQLLSENVNCEPAANINNSDASKQTFTSPQDFIDTLLPVFQRYAQPLGLNPRALLSQAALETGWGKHMMKTAGGENACNLFGIKAGSDWKGDVTRVSTVEYANGVPLKSKENFRAYDNFDDSVRDYVRMMAFSPRYRSAIIKGGNPVGYFKELQKAGYATDPAYAQKMWQIYNHPLLSQQLAQQSGDASANRVASSGRIGDASRNGFSPTVGG